MAAEFDLVIIGSGPGGYVAAIRASQLGQKVAIVERESLGGICLNWGCIPTKALLKSGEKYESLSHLKEYGLSATGASFDFDAIIQRSRGVAATMNKGVTFLMKKLGGKELKDLDEEIQKYLDKAKAGDQEALKTMNQLNMKKMKKTMRTQMYLLPVILGVIWFIKRRYAEMVFTIPLVNWEMGWFGVFLLLGIPASILAETVIKKLLYR